jgi:hypothetical protein
LRSATVQIRYVLLPGKTDGPEDVQALVRFCADKRSMQAVEVLPYHLLGMEVRLAGVGARWLACGRVYGRSSGCSCLLVRTSVLAAGSVAGAAFISVLDPQPCVPHCPPGYPALPCLQKWAAEGLEYPLVGMPTPSNKEVNAFVEPLQRAGIPVLCSKSLQDSQDA